MRFLICGLGSVGRRHLRNLKALGYDDVVLLRSGESTLSDDELTGLPVERDLRQALKRWEPEAVVIANPTAYHLEIAIPAAAAGCDLLIEKPLSHSTQLVEDLRSAVVRGKGRVLVGFQFRFHPGLKAVHRLLREEAIGRPLSAGAHWGEFLPNWHPWEDHRRSYSARTDLGGGVILTLSHPIDYLRWLLGEVESVVAAHGTLGDLGIEVEDTAEIVLRFVTGPLGAIHLNYNQRPTSHWLEIVGTQGTLCWNDSDGVVRLYRAGPDRWESFPPPEGFERNSMFLDEMRHFVQVVAGKAEPVCDLEDGVQALLIATAAKVSSSEARWIRI